MSQPPHSPNESWGGSQGAGGNPPPGYPPQPPGYAPQPPGYSSPPPGHAPQPPGYGATPPGYAPPPPGYGPPPPGYGPPPPGYGSPPGVAPSFNAGEAFSWAWNKFGKNAAALIVPYLLYFLLFGVIGGVTIALAISTSDHQTVTNNGDGYYSTSTMANLTATSIAIIIVGYLLIFVVGVFMQAGMLSGALDIADGKPVSIGSFFRPRNLGPLIAAALLILIGTGIGALLCVLPGVIFAFFAQFAVPFVVDRSLSPVEAIKASVAAVRANIGGALVSYLLQMAVVLVGELLCGVGLIAAVPVALLIQVYTYRRLTGGQVAPLTA